MFALPCTLQVRQDSFPLREAFTISRGSKTVAEAITVILNARDNADQQGRGECIPYGRYGESLASVASQIESCRTALDAGLSREALLDLLPAGAARNALDCALWDLEARRMNSSVWQLAGLPPPHPVETAYTISLNTPVHMAERAQRAAVAAQTPKPLLKIKLGSRDVPESLLAIHGAVPAARLIIDANESWTAAQLEDLMPLLKECGAVLIEQPLAAGQDLKLRRGQYAVPVCADESLHCLEDLAEVANRYDAINIKLDKTGGLTAALPLAQAARMHGLKLMIGCMAGSSLGMAPALLLATDADFVDLDGSLLLAADRPNALTARGHVLSPASPALWG